MEELPNEESCLCGKQELHRLLDEALESAKTKPGRPAEEVFADIERKFNSGLL